MFHTSVADFLLQHWHKVKALADLLVYRWQASLSEYPSSDTRYGIPPGLDEGDGFIAIFAGHPGSHGGYANQLAHMYSCAGGIYRGLEDIGRIWLEVGKKTGRADVTAHGSELLAIAPKLRAAIQTSISKTSWKLPNGRQCIPNNADRGLPNVNSSCTDGGGRSYPELFYSGVLNYQQVDDIYTTLTTSNNSGYGTRPMTLVTDSLSN